jgi:LysR family transcriptional regulator for metE and metH
MPLSPSQIRLVECVSREGTLSRAARALSLTQSALSHQLAKLERQIRTPVFVRTGKRMIPTAAGRLILERGKAILEATRALEEELGGIARGSRGTIRLTASCFTCYHWLPEVLPQFREVHPDIEVRLVPERSVGALDALDEGAVDLVLTYDALDHDDERLDALPLFEDEQVLVVAPGHRLADRPFVQAEDLAGEHLFLHYGPPETSLFMRTVMIPAGVQPARISEVRLTEGILGLVAAGVGVAVVTRWTAAPELASGRVVALRIGKFGVRREWKAVRLSGDAPAHLDEFRALLRLGPSRLFQEPERERERREAGIILAK